MQIFIQQLANGVVLGAAYVLVALGLYLVFSVLHIPNFAHGEFFALGAYFQYMLVVQAGLAFWVAAVPAVMGVAFVGVVSERTVLVRLRDKGLLPMLVGTLALGIVIQQAIALIWGTGALSVPSPINGVATIGGVRIANYRLFVIVVVLVTAGLVGALVYRSDFGKRLRSMAQNKDVAQLAGVNVGKVTVVTFAVGSALAGLAGVLLSAVAPLSPTMGFHPMLVAFVILVMMGAGGRLAVAVAGGMTVAVVETLTAGYITNAFRLAVVFIALVLFLLWRPEGAVRHASTERARL